MQCALFLYWLRTNDIYFLEKKTKRHNWKRIAERRKTKGAKVLDDTKKQNRNQISNDSSDSCVKNKSNDKEIYISITSSAPPPPPPPPIRALTMQTWTKRHIRLTEQRPGKEYCLIYHQFFSPCQFPASFFLIFLSFPVIYHFHLHIKTHLLIKRICVVDVAIENTHGSKIMFGCIDWIPVYFFPSII